MTAFSSYNNFNIIYWITQLVGLAVVIMTGCWVGVHQGGVAWNEQPSIQFNWHSLLMTIGLIYLYGTSILVYRGFRHVRKQPLKITHAIIHAVAFVCTVIALVAVFESKDYAANPRPHMYSLHSWLGMAAVVLFGLQYVVGFVAYLFPGVRVSLRSTLMPTHIFFGVLGFVLSIIAALTGFMAKAIFAVPDYSSLTPEAVLVNMISLLMTIYGGLVVFLVTESGYKREALPEDAIQVTRNHS
ncbi:transmembrane ascorbate-dependent reductase CYB561-like [Armigeres subalbatus]|uniref:transmembrane ascorbate-dependent reductase CYB561-like n=1 Tax=Armigeres subalbatus TaxID=124917 RepID=UPI002ED5C112